MKGGSASASMRNIACCGNRTATAATSIPLGCFHLKMALSLTMSVTIFEQLATSVLECFSLSATPVETRWSSGVWSSRSLAGGGSSIDPSAVGGGAIQLTATIGAQSVSWRHSVRMRTRRVGSACRSPTSVVLKRRYRENASDRGTSSPARDFHTSGRPKRRSTSSIRSTLLARRMWRIDRSVAVGSANEIVTDEETYRLGRGFTPLTRIDCWPVCRTTDGNASWCSTTPRR